MARLGLLKLICSVLGKSLVFLKNRDNFARRDFLMLPENLTISLSVLGDGLYLYVVKTESDIVFTTNASKKSSKADLEITFKNRKSALKTFLGKISIRESFAQHNILLKGNINTSAIIVRLLEAAQYNIFPRIITRKFLPKRAKSFSSFRLIMFILFGSIKTENSYFNDYKWLENVSEHGKNAVKAIKSEEKKVDYGTKSAKNNKKSLKNGSKVANNAEINNENGLDEVITVDSDSGHIEFSNKSEFDVVTNIEKIENKNDGKEGENG